MTLLRTSIAMASYNGGAYLEEQLRSIAGQTRLPDELIICDDQSTDGTVSVAERFASEATFKVDVRTHSSRLGIAGNFGRAISLCSGDVILLCDQDDRWHREKIARFAGVFESRPEVGLVCCDADVMGEGMQPAGFTAWQSVGFTASMQEQVNRGECVRDFPGPLPDCGGVHWFQGGFSGVGAADS